MDTLPDEKETPRLLWGLLLAWVPLLFFVLPVFTVFRGFSAQKATGVGAIAGGLSGALVSFGFVTMVVFELGAIVLLARALSRSHPVRTLLSLLSICCSGLMIAVLTLFLVVFFVRLPQG